MITRMRGFAQMNGIQLWFACWDGVNQKVDAGSSL